MLDDRLSDIAMLSVHSQRADALDLDLVDNFANKCRIRSGSRLDADGRLPREKPC